MAQRNDFNTVDEFIDRLISSYDLPSRLTVSREYDAELLPVDDLPKLPDRDIVDTIVKQSIRSSYFTDEHRTITFSLMYCSKEQIYAHKNQYSHNYLIYEFDRHIDFNDKEIKRLSQINENGRTALLTFIDDDRKLIFWGLLAFRSDWFRILGGEDLPRDRIPYYPLFVVKSPGYFKVACMGNTILSYRGIEIDEKMEGAGDAFTKLYRTVVSSNLFGFISNFVHYLGNKVVKFGHGGTIVIIPNPEKAFEKKLITSDYPLATNNANNVSDILDTIETMNRKLLELHIANPGKPDVDRVLLDDLLFNRELLYERLYTIALLTQTDGAVVLDQDFSVKGFGCLLKSEIAVSQIYPIMDSNMTYGAKIDTRIFGTRHKSAFSIVKSIPNALVLLFSEDGSNKIVFNYNGDVCVFDNVDYGP